MATRAGNDRGFIRLWRGTPDIGCCMAADRGYIPNLRGVGGSVTTVKQFCEDNDVLLLTPAKEGEPSLEYNTETHRLLTRPDVTDEVWQNFYILRGWIGFLTLHLPAICRIFM